MAALPEKLADTLDTLDLVTDRNERIQLLIDMAERFREVPREIAARPFAPETLVPACESESHVFHRERPDGNLDYYFAVENPQGISAKAMAVILESGVKDAPLEDVARIPDDIVYRVFGRELSMGKSMGLMGMVGMVANLAKRKLAAVS